MKVGIFTDTYFPQINGVATSIHTLQKELTLMGHEVYIITASHPKAKKEEFNVIRIKSIPFVFVKNHRVAINFTPKIYRIVKKLNLDVIHTQTEFSMGIFGKSLAKSLSIPTVHTYHTMYEDYVHYIAKGYIVTPKMARNFSRFFCNSSAVVIAPADKAKNFLLKCNVAKPIEVIPTGIDISPFINSEFTEEEDEEIKKSYNIDKHDKIIVVVGRIAKEKSIDTIIKSIKPLSEKLKNVKLIIIGDGPVKSDLELLSKELNLENNVIFLGEKTWDLIPFYYKLGDIFVSASVTETQGLTFTEAMASKILVVAKKDASIENVVINNLTGKLFENDEDLSDVLFEILTDSDEQNRIVTNAFDFVNTYTSVDFAKKVENIYTNLNQKKKRKTNLLKYHQFFLLKKMKIKKSDSIASFLKNNKK